MPNDAEGGKTIAKAQNRAFNDLWKTLKLERFLARLARSDKLDRFIFKGGFLLSKYLRPGRETADLDFSLTGTEGSVESVRALIEDIIILPYDYGFSFQGLTVEEMKHPHMSYPGYDVSTTACLGQTRTKIRMDIGIGDEVVPERNPLPFLHIITSHYSNRRSRSRCTHSHIYSPKNLRLLYIVAAQTAA